MLLLRIRVRTFAKKIWRRVAFAVLILFSGLMIAGTTELFQGMTDYRSADIMDLVADGSGIITGMGIVGIITFIARRK